jgi:hypothetical protein
MVHMLAAGAESRDLGARDKRPRMVSQHTRPPSRLWKTRGDTVQITGPIPFR